MKDPESRLMLRFQKGDLSAFEQLVRRNRSRFVNFIFRYLGDPQGAEDLAQEVLIRIYRAQQKYQPTAKFCTWAYRIAVNLSLNALRDRKKLVSLPLRDGEDEGDLEVVDPAAPSPAEILVREETAAGIRRAIDRLPENQRTALILNRFEGFSYQEISEVMDLSVMAVKSLLSRAREKVKEYLLPYLDGRAKGLSGLKVSEENQ